MNIRAIIYTLCLLNFFVIADLHAQDMEIIYYHNDTLGSPKAATDENGDILWRENYAPYGKKLEEPDAEKGNHIGYTGKPHERITGFTYMNARYYDPLIGRFMAVDPVEYIGGGQQYFQRYTYADNNPYKYTDPSGERVAGSLASAGDSLGRDNHGVNRNRTEGAGTFSARDGHTGNGSKLSDRAGLAADIWAMSAVENIKNLLEVGGGLLGSFLLPRRVNDLKYDPRVRERGVEDPRSHNFPYSYDKEILKTKPIDKKNGYKIYQKEGTMTGKVVTDPKTGERTQQYKTGVFEIGVRRDGVIDHRFFRPTE